MHVTVIKTDIISPGELSVEALLDKYLVGVKEGSVVAVTSKIISLCENRVVSMSHANKEDLIKKYSQYYIPGGTGKYGYHFSIAKKTLVAMAGIDESNGDGNYVLWPIDLQNSANTIREYIVKIFNLQKVGVVITDSTLMPLRYGTVGVVLAYSGFEPLNDYRGKPDLFGKKFKVSTSNIAAGLSAAAVLAMGEGTEQTPIAVLNDLPFVKFNPNNPTQEELDSIFLSREEDVFSPLIDGVTWQKGDNAV
ncbi:MAG: dihydrofolate synthase / folylpolyglutamate synthase [Patescibacteria group bacterium]|nr:dihydrofolate synthase / folylpolyglutamate synthase [Patescibacteria group bacterium]